MDKCILAQPNIDKQRTEYFSTACIKKGKNTWKASIHIKSYYIIINKNKMHFGTASERKDPKYESPNIHIKVKYNMILV